MTRDFSDSGFRRVLTILALAALPALQAPASANAENDDPQEFQKLERQLRQEYNATNYEAALKTAEKMHEIRPDNADTIYNIACLQCLLGNKTKAYESLEKAVKAGYRDADHLQNDYDFRAMRGEDRFREIVRRIRDDNAPSDDKPAPKNSSDKEPKADDDDDDMTPSERLNKVQELTGKMIAAAEKKDYKAALKLAQEAHGLAEVTKNPSALALTKYNLACMHSLLKEKDESLEWLEGSIAAGAFSPDMAGQMEQDGDLDFIRDDPRYKKILEKARKSGATRVEPETKVTLPKKYDKSKKAPLLVVLHPWGGDMNETAKRWQPVADNLGAILLTPQGTYRLPDDHYRWDQDIDLVEHDVLEAVESVMDQYKVDEDRVAIAGFSQGAWAAYALAVRNPDLFNAVIALGGRFTNAMESEADGDELADLDVTIMFGEDEDDQVRDSNRAAEKFFKGMKCDVHVKEFAGIGHEYPENATEEFTRALKRAWE